MINFQNVVVAGTKLVRDAIQSPNYVAGTSGWTINQDGSVEFNNATFRGTLIVNGLNNSRIQAAAVSGQPQMSFYPGDQGSNVVFPAVFIASEFQPSPLPDELDFDINGPFYQGTPHNASIGFSAYKSGTFQSQLVLDAGRIDIQAEETVIRLAATDQIYLSAPNGVIDPGTGIKYQRSQTGAVSVSVSAGAGTQAVTFPLPFPVGVTPAVLPNITTSAGASAGSVPKAVSISNTGFTMVINGGGTYTASVQWCAVG